MVLVSLPGPLSDQPPGVVGFCGAAVGPSGAGNERNRPRLICIEIVSANSARNDVFAEIPASQELT
jgi:hypothetical protein